MTPEQVAEADRKFREFVKWLGGLVDQMKKSHERPVPDLEAAIHWMQQSDVCHGGGDNVLAVLLAVRNVVVPFLRSVDAGSWVFADNAKALRALGQKP